MKIQEIRTECAQRFLMLTMPSSPFEARDPAIHINGY
jgi:hypothetical protein